MPGLGMLSRWSRAQGLPRATYDAWAESMRSEPGRPVRVLAWTHAERDAQPAFVVGSPAALSYGFLASWRHVGWHQVEHGGWNADLGQLSWVELDGHRGSVSLVEPGRLPELFRERVEATIAVKRFVSLSGERGVVVSARRDLGAPDRVTWHTSLTRGLSWRTPGVREAADEALAETRAEYDIG